MRPVPDPSDIHVDEVRIRVVADPTGAERLGGVAQGWQRPPRDPDVDGHARDVKAGGGDTAGGRREHGIGGRRAVAGDDLEGLAGIQSIMEVVQQGQEPPIDRVHRVGAMVAKEPVDLAQALAHVAARRPVRRPHELTRVQIAERKRPHIGGHGGTPGRHDQGDRPPDAGPQEPPARPLPIIHPVQREPSSPSAAARRRSRP